MKVTNAVMVVPVISFWEANKRSERGSKEIADLHHMENTSMARVWKSLFPESVEYGKLRSVRSKMRTFVYRNTLSGMVDGERLLPTKNYRDFMEGIRALDKEFQLAVQDFCVAYPKLVDKARVLLNGLFDEKDYPDATVVARRFKMEVKIRPVPIAEHFEMEIEGDEIEAARKQATLEANRIMKEANKELWYRLHDAVQDIAERLANPSGRILDKSLENLSELLEVMGKLNVTEDQNLDKILATTKQKLATLNAEAVKKDSPERVVAAQDADDIVKAMSAFMGA